MNIIGVELHLPKRGDLKGLAVLPVVCIVVALALVSSGLFRPVTIELLLIGIVSGTFAGACGCSIQKQGIRGVIVIAGFWLVTMAICATIFYLTKLF